jgi:2-dehydropantoate 2-reductase
MGSPLGADRVQAARGRGYCLHGPESASAARTAARTAVIGGGAVGGLIAAFVREAGHDVTLCLRTPVDELRVESEGRVLRPDVRLATRPEQVSPVDWVFLTTKAQDTGGAAGRLRALCRPGTVVAVVQNGVDHAERVTPLLPPGAEVLPTLAYTAVERIAPGRIAHHAASELHVERGPSAERLQTLLAGSRITTRLVDDFRTAAWRKLLTNAAANPLTALLQQRLVIFRDPEMLRLAESIAREAAAVARAEGALIEEADIRRTLKIWSTSPPGGGSSMLYDRLAGRPLEQEHITGAVVRAGERHGVPTPLNSMLLTLLRAVDGQSRSAEEP